VSITPLDPHKTAVALLELTTMLRGGPPTMASDAPPEYAKAPDTLGLSTMIGAPCMICVTPQVLLADTVWV
jgi:hypothetical protein